MTARAAARVYGNVPGGGDGKKNEPSFKRLRIAMECIAEAESLWDPEAHGPGSGKKEDLGLFQVTTKTWKDAKKRDERGESPLFYFNHDKNKRCDPEQNAKSAIVLVYKLRLCHTDNKKRRKSIYAALNTFWYSLRDVSPNFFKCMKNHPEVPSMSNNKDVRDYFKERLCPKPK